MLAGAHEVVQGEGLLFCPQAIGHRQQGGDADAGAEEQVFGGAGVQREEVARRTHFQFHAHLHGIVQGGRTTP